jgi:hypothetical protein
MIHIFVVLIHGNSRLQMALEADLKIFEALLDAVPA